MNRSDMTAHRTCSRKFFMTGLTSEMFGFLMLMKNNFVIAYLVTVVTEWFEITLVLFFSSH